MGTQTSPTFVGHAVDRRGKVPPGIAERVRLVSDIRVEALDRC
jgi:hypothetical protein